MKWVVVSLLVNFLALIGTINAWFWLFQILFIFWLVSLIGTILLSVYKTKPMGIIAIVGFYAFIPIGLIGVIGIGKYMDKLEEEKFHQKMGDIS